MQLALYICGYETPGKCRANSIFIEKKSCLSGPVQFKLILFKGQLSFNKHNIKDRYSEKLQQRFNTFHIEGNKQ